MAVWSLLFSSSRPEPSVAEIVQPSEPEVAEQPANPEKKPERKPRPVQFDRRWLPDRTALVFSLHVSHLAAQPQASKLIGQAEPVWRPSIGAVLRSLGLTLNSVQRLTWASTDLAVWPERSVVVIELEEGHDARALSSSGEAVDVGAAPLACRRMPSAPWPLPFAILDQRTIITGHEELLRGLAQRSEPHLESAAIDRLLKAAALEADATLLLDLNAARAAHWKLPATLLDVWPAGKRPWHILWEIPEGFGCSLRWSDALHGEVALACEGETTAEKVRAAADELLPAANAGLAGEMETLQKNFQAGRITAATAGQYKLLLDEASAALRAAHWDTTEAIVWLRLHWTQSPLATAAAAIDGLPAAEADWLSAALAADKSNHARMLAGLGGYAKAEGHYPAGVAGGALLPPETRLSWIATMLPYFGHPDWHRSWSSATRGTGRRTERSPAARCREVVNPALGPAATEAGFPVTHYVGVAGVGPDAGELPADDPRAGRVRLRPHHSAGRHRRRRLATRSPCSA